MKTYPTISSLLVLFILTFSFNSKAQDIDYWLEGCVPTLNVTPQSQQLAQPSQFNHISVELTPKDKIITPKDPFTEQELKKIWEEMESLTLNMIDLEVAVLDLRAEQLKVVPFSNYQPNDISEDQAYDDLEEELYEEESTDHIKYEMLQMARHLNSLIYEVHCIRDEVAIVNPYPESSSARSETTDYYSHRSIPIMFAAKPALQVEVTIESFWKEMEEMAIQAMDLEVEISDLRVDLSKLKRNAWELDQIALRRNNQNDL